MNQIKLYWQKYKMFPYEKVLGLREVKSLLAPESIIDKGNHLIVTSDVSLEKSKDLVYFSHAESNNVSISTDQYFHEKSTSIRQNTRYSVHGMHEYKGKFNPQIVRVLFNIFNIDRTSKVLDPFCGSGTSLIEASINNISAIGVDINPLAVFIANTKIKTLHFTPDEIKNAKEVFLSNAIELRKNLVLEQTTRIDYLSKWFLQDILYTIESLRLSADLFDNGLKDLFLVLVSNRLRDYSEQEPADLRIRRRKSPYPEIAFLDQLSLDIDNFINSISEFQISSSTNKSSNQAINIDIKDVIKNHVFDKDTVDFVVTSPPYANALPYIDTQRLSIVWLGFTHSDNIKLLESQLIGSREINSNSEKNALVDIMKNNVNQLPKELFDFCIDLQNMLSEKDGFRKKLVPSLLYKYFSEMKNMFEVLYEIMRVGKHFCLVVGHNHTTIGDRRNDINTPHFLSLICSNIGYNIDEIIPLETYQRFGIHASNAVNKESLIILSK